MALTQEDLQAIEQILDKKLEEKLEAKLEEKLEAKLEEKLEAKLDEKLEAKLDEKLAPINKRLDAMQKDITHIKSQVDIAYTWVDRIDLRVRALERG